MSVARATSITRGHIFEPLIGFAIVADLMSWLDIILGMESLRFSWTGLQWNNVVKDKTAKVRLSQRNINGTFTDIAPRAITFKNSLIVNRVSFSASFLEFTPIISVSYFQGVFLLPNPCLFLFVFCYCWDSSIAFFFFLPMIHNITRVCLSSLNILSYLFRMVSKPSHIFYGLALLAVRPRHTFRVNTEVAQKFLLFTFRTVLRDGTNNRGITNPQNNPMIDRRSTNPSTRIYVFLSSAFIALAIMPIRKPEHLFKFIQKFLSMALGTDFQGEQECLGNDRLSFILVIITFLADTLIASFTVGSLFEISHAFHFEADVAASQAGRVDDVIYFGHDYLASLTGWCSLGSRSVASTLVTVIFTSLVYHNLACKVNSGGVAW